MDFVMNKKLLLLIGAGITSLALLNTASADYQFRCADDAFSFEIPYTEQGDMRYPVGYQEGDDFISGFKSYANNTPNAWAKSIQFATGQKLNNFDFNKMFSVNAKIDEFIEKLSAQWEISGGVYPFQLWDLKLNLYVSEGAEDSSDVYYMLQTKEGEEKLLPVGGADDEGNQIPNFFDPSTKKFYQLVQGDWENETETSFTQSSTMRSCKFVEIDKTPEIIESAKEFFVDSYEMSLDNLGTGKEQKQFFDLLAHFIEQGKKNPENVNYILSSVFHAYTRELNSLDNEKETKIFTETLLNALKNPEATIEKIIKEYGKNVETTPSETPSVKNVENEATNQGLEFSVEKIKNSDQVIASSELPRETISRNLSSQMKKKDFLALKNQPLLVVAQHFGINFEKEKKALAEYFGIKEYRATYAQNMKIKEELLKKITVLD